MLENNFLVSYFLESITNLVSVSKQNLRKLIQYLDKLALKINPTCSIHDSFLTFINTNPVWLNIKFASAFVVKRPI